MTGGSRTYRGLLLRVVPILLMMACQASEHPSDRILGENFFPPDGSAPDASEENLIQPGTGGADDYGEGLSASPPPDGSDSAAEASDPSCYDGRDDNGNGLVDCQDPRCHGEASCCVNSGACCEASRETGFPPRLDLQECTGVIDCLGEGWMTFGAPSVWEGNLYPGVVQSVSSGAHSISALNLQGVRLSVGVDFRFPENCGTSCMETVAIGLTAQGVINMHEQVTPLVALVASGSRREVRLVIQHETVAAWPAEGDEESWELILKPTGLLSVSQNGTPLLTEQPYPSGRQARVAIYGRNRVIPSPTNPTASGAMGIQALRFETAKCDIASAWAPPLGLQIDGPELSPTVSSVSFAPDPDNVDRALLAVEDSSRFTILERTADHWSTPSVPAIASFAPVAPHERGGIEDPELVWSEDRVHLYYTAISDRGSRFIALATTPSSLESPWERGTAPVINRTTDPEFIAQESPSVVLHHSGTWVMVTLATRADASQAMPVYTSRDGVEWERLRGAGLAELEATSVFGGPELSLHAHVWYLHVARRRGTRWRIEAAVSDQLLHWRRLGEVMHPSLIGSALGLTEPDLAWEPGRLAIRFIARSSSGRHLLSTERISAAEGVFLE